MGNQEFIDDLRRMIGQSQVVGVVGSGVSIATTSQAPTWRALLEAANERCRAIGAEDAWCRIVALQVEHGSAGMLLSAAENVHAELRANGGGEWSRWLRDRFEELQPEDAEVVESLAALDMPLVTTNYDDLIEKVSGLRHVTWQDSRNLSRVIRGDDRRVLHLHGHWEEPASVVLGIRSYEEVKEHRHTQAVLQACGVTKSLLFVGCGDEGLADPNWGNFLTWLEAIETSAGVEHRHYRLVREADKFEPRGRLYPLVYGKDYSDLPSFLKTLVPESRTRAAGGNTSAAAGWASLPENISYYLQCLADETAHLTLLGMGRNLQVELPIEEAYVPLRTTLARSLEARETERFKEGHAEHEEEVALGEVFRKATELKLRGVILLGEPGSGKTTGARQLAWRLASRQSLPEDLGLPAGMTPVFLRFRNLSRAALKKKNGLRQFLEAETDCAEAPDGMESPGADLWNRQGLLWILDGLDEVVDPGARKKVSGWIRNATKNRPDDHFLVTCRFAGYFREGVPLGPKFVEFHVRPLDDGQVQQFVRDWFGAAYGKLLGPGARADTRAQADSNELLDILSRSEYQTGHIRELSTNPLLLTILCIVFHEERELPTGRAELYAHCVEVLLEYWRRDLYDSGLGAELQPYNAEAAQSVLARVAWWMHQEQDRTSAHLDELAAEAAKGLAGLSPSSGLGLDGHAFLERMRDETGILAMSAEDEGRCGFLHLSFQEYLAAEHATREGLAKELAAKAAESWWREAALLSLRRSRAFCEEFFREMLDAGNAENHPDLAERCLQEALYFAGDPFIEVLERPRPKAAKARRVHDARVSAVLRLLRDRADQVPQLAEISRRLATSKDTATQGFAAEILIRGSTEMRIEPRQQGIFVDAQSGITYVAIPAGEFQMGGNAVDKERPIHRIEISKSFWLGKYPVTNAQFERFVQAAGLSLEKPKYWADRRFSQPQQPVVGVSWDDACAYCAWAGGRLPQEAEWEYACRAGTMTEYSFGDDAARLVDYGWFEDNSNGQTQPVGAKKPNPWGVCDMHGNVWEWCEDWQGSNYYGKSPTVDPTGPSEGSYRVRRGGSWFSSPLFCRSAYRIWNTPSYRYYYLGFRVARSSVEPKAEPGT